MGTVHQLADRRGDRADARPAGAVPWSAELANWRLLADRAGDALGAVEAAAAGRRRPGLAALAAETAGLRTALENALFTLDAIRTVWDEAYACGAADQKGAPRPEQLRRERRERERRERLQLVPGGAS